MKAIVFIYILLFPVNIFAQNLLDFEQLEELQKKYGITGKEIVSDSLACYKLYDIPNSVFLNYYPFNADSIIIVYPDSCCNLYETVYDNYEKSEKYHFLAKMSKDEIGSFANNIYNYAAMDISFYYSTIEQDIPPILSQISTGDGYSSVTTEYILSPPNIILLFHHGMEINYIGLYFDEKIQVRIATSFDYSLLYFGEFCPDRNGRLRDFFRTKYNYEIKECSKCDYPLIPLIENRYK